jgi:hypothetical protein
MKAGARASERLPIFRGSLFPLDVGQAALERAGEEFEAALHAELAVDGGEVVVDRARTFTPTPDA